MNVTVPAGWKAFAALRRRRELAVFWQTPSIVALAVLAILAILTSPHDATGSSIFLEPGNLSDIVRQVVVVGIVALGMTFVILTGGIDLSVGSVLALSTVVGATLLSSGVPGIGPDMQLPLAVALALAAGMAIGAINGIVVARLGIQPFIATLATMIGARGLAKWFSGNENIDIGFGADLAARFAAAFDGKLLPITIYAILALGFTVALARTVFGRNMRAVGDNMLASRYAGLPIARIQIAVYALSGLMAGIAGILYAAENHQGNPNAGVAYELDAIAAVVIGGTRLAGGRGTIVGTIIGTLIMGVLTNMLRLNNIDSNIEMMIKAVLIVAAAAIQGSGEK